MTAVHLQGEIGPDLGGLRLDQALARLFPDYSRARLQQWIREGAVQVDGRPCKPRDRVHGGEQVAVRARLEDVPDVHPEPIDLHVVHADEDLIVIDKPAGLVVHPAAGNWAGTLQNALLHRFPELAAMPRAGIVHRLDKDTSGLLVVARTLQAHKSLVDQLQARSLRRHYFAVVQGVLTAGGCVEASIARHPVDRKRMAVVAGGKPAVTHYRVLQRYRAHTLVRASLETGRTHQIRVHMAHIRHPLVGDAVYGGRLRLPPGASDALVAQLRGLRRQALHAERLGLVHPRSGEAVDWHSPLPVDLQQLLDALAQDAGNGG